MDFGKGRILGRVSKTFRIDRVLCLFGRRASSFEFIAVIWISILFFVGAGKGADGSGVAEAGSSRVLLLQVLRVDTLREAEDLMAQLNEGKPLDELAKQYAPEELKERSGYLGIVREENLQPAIRAALSKRKEGEISGPVEVEGHYVILKVLKPEEAASFQAAPGSAEYYLNLGLILGEKSDHEGEIEAYREAAELAPEMKEAYVNLGEALRRKAIRVLRDSNRKGTLSSETGEVALAILDDAIDQFKLALSIDPDFAEAHYDLGLAYVAEGLFDLALLEFKEAIRLRPADGEIQKSMASTYLLKGEYELAKVHAERARALGADTDALLLRIQERQRYQAPKRPRQMTSGSP